MAIILGTLIAVAFLIIVGISTAAALVLCKKRSIPNEGVICPGYEGNLEDVHKGMQKGDMALIVKVPVNKPKKMNNREVAPPEIDAKALQMAQEALPPEAQKRNSIAKANRQSMSFTPMNNAEIKESDNEGKNSLKKTQMSGVNNLRNVEGVKDCSNRPSSCEDTIMRNHPRVTLGPEGQVMRCIITEGSV